MKKKIALALVAVMAVSMVFAGCGNKKNSSSGSTVTSYEVLKSLDYSPKNYVSLPNNYMKLDVTVTGDYTVNSKSIKAYAAQQLSRFPYYKKTSKKVVENKDTVNIDYTGKMNGKAFEGGSAKGTNLEIGSKMMIDGFESGLKGHKVGEKVTLNLTFPKNYSNKKLAGKKATFEVKINYIAKKIPMTYDTITDDFVKTTFKAQRFTTAKALKEQLEKSYKQLIENSKQKAVQSAVLTKLVEESKVTLPKGLLKDRVEKQMKRVEDAAKAKKTSLEKYIKSTYNNLTEAQYRSTVENQLEKSLKQELILQAIVQVEKVEFKESDYKTFVTQLLNMYGLSSEEAFYKQFSGGKEYVQLSFAENQALNKVSKGANVTYKKAANTSNNSANTNTSKSNAKSSK